MRSPYDMLSYTLMVRIERVSGTPGEVAFLGSTSFTRLTAIAISPEE